MKHGRLSLLGGSLEGLRLPAVDGADNPKPGQLAIDGSRIVQRSSGGLWSPLVNFGAPVPEGVMQFTSLGTIGRAPRSGAAFLAEYERRGYAWSSAPEWFTVSFGIQTLTINESGRYRLTLVSPCPKQASWQRGARLIAEVALNKGDKLRMIVGQLGQLIGGAGATCVELIPMGSTTARPLAISAGCAGASTAYNSSNVNVWPKAPISSLSDTSGGAAQNGFQNGRGGGGAGYTGDGTNATGGFVSTRLSGTALGGIGYGSNQSIEGGFGGGGGGADGTYTLNPHLGNPPTRVFAAGGGGGLKGGGAGVQSIQPVTAIPAVAGAGGTSYCATADQVSFAYHTEEVGSIQVEMI